MWENYVGTMEVETIEDLEPESWEDGNPNMPCVPCTHAHREKLKEQFPRFHNAMLSRPVGKKEMRRTIQHAGRLPTANKSNARGVNILSIPMFRSFQAEQNESNPQTLIQVNLRHMQLVCS